MRTLFAKGILLMLLAVGFLPLSFFLRQELTTSVGGTSTGRVFVPVNSAAAKRGYALPGESRSPANFIGIQFDRSKKVLAWSALAFVAGAVMSAIALIARRTRSADIGTSQSVISIIELTAVLGILPLVGGFDAVLILLCAASVVVVLVKRFEMFGLFQLEDHRRTQH